MMSSVMDISSTKVNIDCRPLDRARHLKGWTIQELARRSGRSVATVSRTLAGKSKGVRTVSELADILSVDLSEVVNPQSAIPNPQLTDPQSVDRQSPRGAA